MSHILKKTVHHHQSEKCGMKILSTHYFRNFPLSIFKILLRPVNNTMGYGQGGRRNVPSWPYYSSLSSHLLDVPLSFFSLFSVLDSSPIWTYVPESLSRACWTSSSRNAEPGLLCTPQSVCSFTASSCWNLSSQRTGTSRGFSLEPFPQCLGHSGQ